LANGPTRHFGFCHIARERFVRFANLLGPMIEPPPGHVEAVATLIPKTVLPKRNDAIKHCLWRKPINSPGVPPSADGTVSPALAET